MHLYVVELYFTIGLYASRTLLYVIGLKIMQKVSAILRPLSLRLQSKGADLVQSLELIDATLASERSSGFDLIFSEAEAMAESMDVEISLPRLVAKGKSVFRRLAGINESLQDYY